MKIAAIIFFIFSAFLLLGAIKYFLELTRPGVYPPKQILKKRAAALAGGGGIFLLIAIMITYFL
ncbi:hypothetical protein V7152_14730 [Neobacillus drentensis]|uniref:hypothetical protein n=1 Tax=Neobacillus drentensis TaxID=220684 RepID=UPI003000E151